MIGTTPPAAFAMPITGAPASRTLETLMPTPPPIFDNCSAEFIVRPIEFISSDVCITKHDTNSPRRARPAFKKEGVAG